MTQQTATAQNVQYVLEVPELWENSIAGGGCCAVPMEFLIEETLGKLEQVQQVIVAEEDGEVYVTVSEATQKLLEELTGRIEDLGFRVLGSDLTA